MQRKHLNLILLYGGLPLVAGALVYLFFRPANFLSQFFGIRQSVPVTNAVLRHLFFVLPDFCWSYSLACALYLFAISYYLNFRKSAILIFVLVAGSELVQLLFPKYFTFDGYDLAATVAAFVLSTVQMKKIAYAYQCSNALYRINI